MSTVFTLLQAIENAKKQGRDVQRCEHTETTPLESMMSVEMKRAEERLLYVCCAACAERLMAAK